MTKFRLHRIIEVKEKLIEDKEGELEIALNVLSNLNHDIEAIGKDIDARYQEMITPSLSGGDFSIIRDHLVYLENRRAILIDERENAEERIRLLRAQLVELLKELKMLETLKAKTVKAIKKIEHRKEQKNLDGMALRLDERRL